MVARIAPELVEESRVLWKEANELYLIFVTIVKNSRNKKDK